MMNIKIKKFFLINFTNPLKCIKILIIILSLFYTKTINSKTIGFIENISGDVFQINKNEKIVLDILDEVLIGEFIEIGSASSLTINLNDGTIIVLSEKTKLIINSYENDIFKEPGFEIEIVKGSFIIETGEIPKLGKNIAVIKTPKGKLFLNGTAVSANFNSSNAEIFLLTDSLGNQGGLDLLNENGDTIAFKPDEGIIISEDNSITSSELNENTASQIKTIKEAIIESAIPNEEKINKAIENKVSKGKIIDLDGDGKIDESDINLLKNQIILSKETKLNSIINNSEKDVSLINSIVVNSQESGGQMILNKIMDNNPEITSKVIDKLIDEDPNQFEKIVTKDSNFLEKVLITVTEKASSNDPSIGNIIAKADISTSQKLLENITKEKGDLVLEIVSQVGKNNSSQLNNLLSENKELKDNVTTKITETIENSSDGVEKLKEVMVTVDTDITDNIVKGIKDESITDNAIKLAFVENKEILEEKLSKSITNEESLFTKKIVTEAITSGDLKMINTAVNTAIKNNDQQKVIDKKSLNNTNQTSSQEKDPEKENIILKNLNKVINESSAEIEKNGKNINDKIQADMKILITEKLVSPN